MPSTPVPGFITKADASEHYNRSHRQLTRDLSDAMKVQDSTVLDHCRLRTEDGTVLQATVVTPELIDQLLAEGKNPVWYLRSAWLEKTFGRRGSLHRPGQARSEMFLPDAEKVSDATTRPDLIHVLRERIQSLERDKQDLRDEMKIKNQQIADRVEREKETNALIRDLHTLMADSQRRLLPPPTQHSPSITDGFAVPQVDRSSLDIEDKSDNIETTSSLKSVEKGTSRTEAPQVPPQKQRMTRKLRRTTSNKIPATKKTGSASRPVKKSSSLWSRLFSN